MAVCTGYTKVRRETGEIAWVREKLRRGRMWPGKKSLATKW